MKIRQSKVKENLRGNTVQSASRNEAQEEKRITQGLHSKKEKEQNPGLLTLRPET